MFNNKFLLVDEAFIDAVVRNDAGYVAASLKEGVNPNTCLDAAQVPPLHFAAQNNSYQVAQLLLLSGADVFAKTSEGAWPKTALEVARLNNSHKVERLLENYIGPDGDND